MPERVAWYGTAKWRRRAKRQLREHPLCAKCANRGVVTPASIADHIEPHRGRYEFFWFGDLQSLCANCHNSFKQFEERNGYSTAIDRDGWPIDPRHPANAKGPH